MSLRNSRTANKLRTSDERLQKECQDWHELFMLCQKQRDDVLLTASRRWDEIARLRAALIAIITLTESHDEIAGSVEAIAREALAGPPDSASDEAP